MEHELSDTEVLWEVMVDEVDEHELFLLSHPEHLGEAQKIGRTRYSVTFTDLTRREATELYQEISTAHIMVGNIRVMTFPYVSMSEQ